MATTGKFDGTLIAIYAGSTKLSHGKGASVDVSKDMIETTTKDSGGYKEYIPGEVGGSMSWEGLMAFDATYGFDDLMAAELAGTLLTLKWSTEVTGDIRLSSNAYISNIKADAPQNDVSTFSCDFQLTGTITKETIA